MAARIEVTNESGEGIDRLELNTIAAKVGGIEVTESSVDDERVKIRVQDQTLVMPLGGVLPDGGVRDDPHRLPGIAPAEPDRLRLDVLERLGGRSRCTAGSRGSAGRSRSAGRTTACPS